MGKYFQRTFLNKGEYLAMAAALCSASVGIFSKEAFNSGLQPTHIAFYKCFLAFLILSLCVLFNRKARLEVSNLKNYLKPIFVCSFFGVFILYFFETLAYSYEHVSTVTFILLSSSTLTTIFTSRLFLSEKTVIFNVILCVLGLWLIFNKLNFIDISYGSTLATVAGIGYGLFLVFTKKYTPNFPKLAFIWWLITFGTLLSFFPFILNNPAVPNLESIIYILPLSTFPTILGSYCTTKALSYAEASRVQFLELMEPIFASLLAFIVLNESLSPSTIAGGVLIIWAIYREHLGSFKKKTPL